MAIPLGETAIHRMAVLFRLALRSGRPRLTPARDVFEMASRKTDMIHQIVAHNDSRVFTLAEAQALFPLVRSITHTAHATLDPVRRHLEGMIPSNPQIHEVEKQYEAIVKHWVAKMERLGLVVKGLWLVDFDTGDGYLCWKFPELKIGHFHDYHEGYTARRSLAEVIEERDPDWAR